MHSFFYLSVKDETRWSMDFPKETPIYWSLRSRLIEEYTESESLLEFAKKTVLVLMKTSNYKLAIDIISFCYLFRRSNHSSLFYSNSSNYYAWNWYFSKFDLFSN
jgi:hypothetical protein